MSVSDKKKKKSFICQCINIKNIRFDRFFIEQLSSCSRPAPLFDLLVRRTGERKNEENAGWSYWQSSPRFRRYERVGRFAFGKRKIAANIQFHRRCLMTVGRHKGEDVSICARVFQTRLTNTDIDRYEINIGLKAQQSRLPGETGGENTAKYSICEGICCVMVHRFCYPNMASLSLSLSLCSVGVATRAVASRRYNTLRTKVPFYFRHVHNWSWLLCCHGKVPFSSETDGYLGSSLLLATARVPFLFAGWLMKGMKTWGEKKKKKKHNTKDALVHEKSKLFFPRSCFLLHPFRALFLFLLFSPRLFFLLFCSPRFLAIHPPDELCR